MDREESILADLEARKRDRKIYITEEAIAKVPFIRYKEIAEEHYDNIYNLVKEVLKSSMLENDSNEVAIVYSLDFDKLVASGQEYMGISYGTEHYVDPGGGTEAYHILRASYDCIVVCMHNHPNLSKISLEDVKYFLRYDNIKMMLVVTNLGSISYIVKSRKFKKDEAIRVYNEAVSINKLGRDLRTHQKAANYFLNKCYRANVVYEDR